MYLKHRTEMNRWRASVVLLWGFVAFAVTAQAASPVWLRVKTDDFVAYSDASQKDLVAFCVRYAAYHQVFRDIFASPGHQPPPTTLILFRRTRDFKDHLPTAAASSDMLNYSVVVDGTALVALTIAGDDEQALANTIEFETTWAVRQCGYYVPLWMAQGAGKVLSSLRVKNGKCQIGSASEANNQLFFGSGKELPWARFFEITTNSPEYLGSKASEVYHSQAWALMHWILLKDSATHERFETLARKLQTESAVEAVHEVMRTDPEKFSYAVRLHLSGFRKAREFEFDEVKVRGALVAEEAPETEMLVQTATLLAAAGRREESDLRLSKARQLSPDLPLVKEARARRALEDRNQDEAIRLYREAISAASTNPTAYIYSANARLDVAAGNGASYSASEAGGRNIDQAVEEIRTVLKLNPGNSGAYQLLGRAYLLKSNITQENVHELDGGVTLGETGEAVRFYRALLWERLGMQDEFRTDLQQIVADPDASARHRAAAQKKLGQ